MNLSRRAAPLARGAAAIFVLALASGSCSPKARIAPGASPRAGEGERCGVAVRATFRGEALPGVRVSWSRSPAPGEVPAAAGTTDAEGKAFFVLPPGRYFLEARWRRDGEPSRPVFPGDRFAYFGGNPVYLARGPVPTGLREGPPSGSGTPSSRGSAAPAACSVREIFLSLEEFAAPPPRGSAPAGASGVSGVVTADGAPVADAHVFAYLRADGGFRDMGFAASSPTGADGAFLLDLPPGPYYLVARKRAAGGVAGPLRKGDAIGCYADNPVTVAPGSLAAVTIPVTLLKFRNAPSYSGEYAAAASVEGRILGRDGKPRRGVYAALYDNRDLLGRPIFLSDVTGDDGRYRLPVPAAGTYYLGARNGYGGSPAPGDLYGRYEGTPDHSLTVREGDRPTGVDIVVDEVR